MLASEVEAKSLAITDPVLPYPNTKIFINAPFLPEGSSYIPLYLF
jgi:hypothetical protein